jgi:hypothetical protein
MEASKYKIDRLTAVLIGLILSASWTAVARASDHLDSPATVANPAADIGDVYAWTSPDGKQLNLVMTIQGHTFSDKLQYVFHIDSGKAFGRTTATTSIVCSFEAANAVKCNVGSVDSASGDPTNAAGVKGRNRRFRVYAAPRDDPFYNNVKGLLGAYQTASTAIKNGAAIDGAGCAHFDAATVKGIVDQMGHTDGGPAQNLLYNWTVSAIVISVDLSAISKGGEAPRHMGWNLHRREAPRSHGTTIREKYLARRLAFFDRRCEWRAPRSIQCSASGHVGRVHPGPREDACA